jgi:hypothetical protein
MGYFCHIELGKLEFDSGNSMLLTSVIAAVKMAVGERIT